jgi:pyridinium-3,5-bisthiocarboxylic acid mononucleotide nickel chelatase
VTRTLWVNPAVGVAGDMLLGALFDLGAPVEAVRGQLDRLGLPGWELRVGEVRRRGLRAVRAEVLADEGHRHRPWTTIDGMLAGAGLAAEVERGARATFRRLAEAEATVHGIDVDEVHFHEVGAVDAIVDIVGVWAARHSLGVAEVVAAPVGLGAGTVRAEHGLLPAPAPATLLLLVGSPTRPVDSPTETATPTGVALLVTMADRWGSLPAGTVAATGFGAGGRDPDSHPNVLNAVLTEADTARRVESVVIETNLDDVTP